MTPLTTPELVGLLIATCAGLIGMALGTGYLVDRWKERHARQTCDLPPFVPTTATFSRDVIPYPPPPETDALYDCSPRGLARHFGILTACAMKDGRTKDAGEYARLAAFYAFRVAPTLKAEPPKAEVFYFPVRPLTRAERRVQ